MNFASDNTAPIADAVLEALAAANHGSARAYGTDPVTARVEARLREIFEHDAAVFLVGTGTAANALALAQMTPPWGAVLGHAEAHVMHDECGAPEFFTNGAKLVGIPGAGGKLTTAALDAVLARNTWSPPMHVTPSAVTLSQATEAGTVYTPDEIAALSELARRHRLRVHMDGARFANAVTATSASPADLTWRSGVEILSFGFTKNGALAAEALVVFAPALVQGMAERRKRGGHLWSKGRYLAAQIDALLANDLWLDLARNANAQAGRLAAGLAERGIRLAFPAEANEVFAYLPNPTDQTLRAAGATYHPWETDAAPAAPAGETLVRLVCSFATETTDVEAFLGHVAPAQN
jgi:threonine aldolase